MSKSNSADHVKPFGDTADPQGYYQLLKLHLTWLATHNFSLSTLRKRAIYVRAFALWCLDRDILAPRFVTRAILEAFQRHLFNHRQTNGKPLAWSSQYVQFKELRQFLSEILA